eukprot:TRINITY_DN46817_c0_g1_i1.p1 TRINITY_DN46817_c0_g1~~TRINITY_DN46817_c0_g1_i1.p1  ORF type:complete len:577 (-),score=133.89 TRINITY_DN46817_c0_g1_i1:16-1746(-)
MERMEREYSMMPSSPTRRVAFTGGVSNPVRQESSSRARSKTYDVTSVSSDHSGFDGMDSEEYMKWGRSEGRSSTCRSSTWHPSTQQTWMLVGQRHEVDERREAMTQGKALFLRVLAQRSEGVWRTRTTARTEEARIIEDGVRRELVAQQQALSSTSAFWAKRKSDDESYLQRLQESRTPREKQLPEAFVRQEVEWVEGVRKALRQSSAWAEQLPKLIDAHNKASGEILAVVDDVRALWNEAENRVAQTRAEVWPRGAEHPDAEGDMDAMPCLWLAVRNYLEACEGLSAVQSKHLARLKNEERRMARLGAWVEMSLDADGEEAQDEPLDWVAPDLDSSACALGSLMRAKKNSIDGSPVRSMRLTGLARQRLHSRTTTLGDGGDMEDLDEAEDNWSDESSDESSDGEGAPNLARDLSPLVVHEQDVKMRRNTDDGESWVSARVLMSVDLWLYVLTLDKEPKREPKAKCLPSRKARTRSSIMGCGAGRQGFLTSRPDEAIPLVTKCKRPVAQIVDGAMIQLDYRPQQLRGFFENLSGMLFGTPSEAAESLWLRCADEVACAELFSALELVNELYPADVD